MTPKESTGKIVWQGKVVSVQPRIRLLRSYDERSHAYLGYALRLEGKIGAEEREFLVGLGKGAQAKHNFQAGDVISGECLLVPDQRLEPVEFYKASKLAFIERTLAGPGNPPPWKGVPPSLEEYRRRGHRRLAAQTYKTRCKTCIWGCHMAVEIIVDHWNPSVRKYRFETFCYGPKSCSFYRAGPTRKVPGRKGMLWEEDDWVDEEETGHREPDE